MWFRYGSEVYSRRFLIIPQHSQASLIFTSTIKGRHLHSWMRQITTSSTSQKECPLYNIQPQGMANLVHMYHWSGICQKEGTTSWASLEIDVLIDSSCSTQIWVMPWNFDTMFGIPRARHSKVFFFILHWFDRVKAVLMRITKVIPVKIGTIQWIDSLNRQPT